MNEQQPRSVVVPVEALEALFRAQTEQVKLLADMVRDVTQKVTDAAMKVEEMKLQDRREQRAAITRLAGDGVPLPDEVGAKSTTREKASQPTYPGTWVGEPF